MLAGAGTAVRAIPGRDRPGTPKGFAGFWPDFGCNQASGPALASWSDWPVFLIGDLLFTGQCRENEFTCGNGQCIPDGKQCDKVGAMLRICELYDSSPEELSLVSLRDFLKKFSQTENQLAKPPVANLALVLCASVH